MKLWLRMRLRKNLSNTNELASVHADFAIDNKGHVTNLGVCPGGEER